MSADDGKLDDCHCCDDQVASPVQNDPGLPALSYRVGTWATFFDTMQIDLAAQGALTALTTRAPDDPTIALLDAWAIVGDILTFYQERIANEGYLRTAVERRSVLELARQIGYELGAGVAASTSLAFTLEQAIVPNAGMPIPTTITIPTGTKVQSVPGPNQLPQTFETIADIEARAPWNVMAPKATQRQRLRISASTDAPVERIDPKTNASTPTASIYLNGTGTNLRPGDLLVIRVANPNNAQEGDSVTITTGTTTMWVSSVHPDYNAKITRVELSQDGADTDPVFVLVDAPAIGTSDVDPMPMTPSNVRKYIIDQSWTEEDLLAFLDIQGWNPDKMVEHVAKLLASDPPPADVYALRTRTGVFGHAAPAFASLSKVYNGDANVPWPYYETLSIWKSSDGTYYSDRHHADLFLDRVVQGVARRGWIALAASKSQSAKELPDPFLVEHVTESSHADFAISGKATGIALSDKNASSLQTGRIGDSDKSEDLLMRTTSVFCQSEQLDVADAPIPEPLMASAGGVEILLDKMVLGLYADQYISVTGMTLNEQTLEPSGSVLSEIRQVVSARHTRGYTLVTIDRLDNSYVRNTVTLNGNVAPATHGSTIPSELLGSGDGSKVHQAFQLKSSPLTYVAATTPSGSESTLVVRVGGVQWTEVPTLYSAGPSDRVFVSRQQDDGTTLITFGDGIRGARVPTGRSNVTATYRIGTGPDGQLKAGNISVLQSKPLGVKSATNPIAAAGAEAPEQLSGARVNAPRTVRTLDRIVSLADFEDFARGFAGIGKVLASQVWNGEQQGVVLTLGDAIGKPIPVDPPIALTDDLRAAIAGASDGRHAVGLAGYSSAFFKLALQLIVDPAYVIDKVVKSVTARLKAAFAYAMRDIGQPVTEAEIILLCQSCPGVIATEVTALYNANESMTLHGVLAPAPVVPGAKPVGAELLLLHRKGLTVSGSYDA